MTSDESERLIRLEEGQRHQTKILERLDEKVTWMCPQVKENSWWINKVKWGFVVVAVSGVGIGLCKMALDFGKYFNN